MKQQQHQHHFLPSRDRCKMKSKSHLYRNTCTQYGEVIMGNAFVRMSHFECRALVLCCRLAMHIGMGDRAKAAATNDPYVEGNYRKCVHIFRRKIGQCWSMNGRSYVRTYASDCIFICLFAHICTVHVHDSYGWAVVTFASILLWQCRYFPPFLSIWNFIFSEYRCVQCAFVWVCLRKNGWDCSRSRSSSNGKWKINSWP